MGKGYVTGCFFMVLLACSRLCGQEETNGIAGSDQVAEVMRTFEGRGTMAD